jgi:hypothetical protein
MFARGITESTFVPISDFIYRNAQEAKRAAGLEMHAHNVRPRFNQQRPRVRPGKECI